MIRKMLVRNWQSFLIKATLKQSSERPWPIVSDDAIAKHVSDRLDGFEAHILKLPQPILCKSAEIHDVVQFNADGKLIRIYPPFPLNETKALSGEFSGPRIPEGNLKVDQHVSVPSAAVGGLTSHPGDRPGEFFCQGLRVDCQSGAPERESIGLLIENIAQFTHQWWLRSAMSPFNGLGRFGAELNKDFSLREELRHSRIDSVESTWYGHHQTQQFFGIERPLTNDLWLLSFDNASQGRHADTGFLSLYDALVGYMNHDDPTCIFRLSNCVEILGNKRRILRNLTVCTKHSQLLRKTDLVGESTRAILKKLFIDRDHVAHGRETHLVGRSGQPSIEDYLYAVIALVSKYLNELPTGQWPVASQINIKRQTNESVTTTK